MPQTTPQAVIGEGSPEPPRATGRPVMCCVRVATSSASSVVVPTSSAARYEPFRRSMNPPSATNLAGVLSVRGSPTTTVLPPPSGKPASEFL